MSVTMHRGLVPPSSALLLRRRLLLEIRRNGLARDDMRLWERTTWWPSLRTSQEVTAIRNHVEKGIEAFVNPLPGLIWAEPQLILRFPDEDDVQQGDLHVDEEPEWARFHSLRYKTIVSVELATIPGSYGGNLVVEHPAGTVPVPCGPMRAGDAVEFSPDTRHAGSPNYGANIRMAVVFRLLTPAARVGEGHG